MKWLASLWFLVLFHGNTGVGDVTELETSVCGRIREPLAFWLFRHASGNPDPRQVKRIAGVERLEHQTSDGRRLRGYLLRSPNPRGYLLVAQGNAMLADQILAELSFFRDRGLDVYVFDYRGYGLSEGKSRLRAIVSDYRELVTALNHRKYRHRYLYGISMGGIILLNAVGKRGSYDALVVDSSPARVSGYGCPRSYDPVENLPDDASMIMVIMGLRDTVVAPGEIMPLVEAAKKRGAKWLVEQEFAHPFQDLDPTLRHRRLKAVAEFILSR